MAAAILPALATGGRAALQALPTVVTAVKENLPTVYAKVSEYTGRTNPKNTPDVIAQTAIVKKDRYLGQALLETLMKNGVSPDFITRAAPVFPESELRTLAVHFQQIDKVERDTADAKAAVIQGDPDEVFAHDNVHIVRLCNGMGISSNILADLCAFITTRGPAQIERYQKFERLAGRKPV